MTTRQTTVLSMSQASATFINGSDRYYNATAEVELRPIFGDVWNETIFGPNYTDNLCSELKNSTQTVKYDAILSILEKDQFRSLQHQRPTSTQRAGIVLVKSKNLTMPVCNTTELSGNYRVGMEEYRSWQAEDWDDFRWPDISVLFDDKTANLTMDAVFSARLYVWPNATTKWSGPQTGSPGAHAFIEIRVSGAIDARHSDLLSLKDETPVWLRTVGFGNDSSNIGYDSGTIKLSFEFTISIMAIALVIMVVL
ncbi:hypothetical protein FAGAP_652 [Fusarium agapanthi]|uniref:Uncharacterized protein n=1 Tax=Fusarium agapanthi TaxID=1803897 RepID=A0A9P5BJ85_9HYPO|nr:hypothetical protein FAGAP_652 [Fusarium agapanthi]